MKKLLFFLGLLGAGLAGVAYWLSYDRRHGPDAEHYPTAAAEYGPISEVVSATGVVQARDVFPVGTELSGKVVEVAADFNQSVREGDLLLRLDDRPACERVRQAAVAVDLARVAVRQAEATRDAASGALRRVRNMSPEVRQQTDLDVAEAQRKATDVGVEAAQVRVREAEEAKRQADLGLRLTEIRAPVLASPDAASSPGDAARGGVGRVDPDATAPRSKEKRAFTVLDRKAVLNQVVGPPASAQLFTLAGTMERMQVLAQVVEGDINKIRRGMAARFTVPGADDDLAFQGTVEEIRMMPASDHGAVFYRVVVDVRNERGPGGDWQLRPGLTASVDFVRRVHDPVWKIPSAALNVQPDPAALTPEGRAKLERLPGLPDTSSWKVAWVVGPGNRPWPLFVRVGGTGARGESGIQDTQSGEVLEWDPELKPTPDPKDPATYPKVILGLPPAKKGGLFSAPNIKL